MSYASDEGYDAWDDVCDAISSREAWKKFMWEGEYWEYLGDNFEEEEDDFNARFGIGGRK